MTIYEEVQLAIDMKIESSLEFVLLAKLNNNGPVAGYWGYFNGRRVWLSCLSAGKLSKFELEYADYRCWARYPNIKHAYLNGMLKGNNLLVREIWDNRTNAAYPKNYFTDDICQINYELKLNSDRINHLQKRLSETTGHNYLYIKSMLTDCYEYEGKIERRKNFIKTGDKSKSIILADYKNYSLLEVVSNYGFNPVRTSGNRFKLCCPLHNENTPSFFIDSDKNTFKCFGCQEYGDTLDFISKYEKISIIDAAKKLSTST